MSLVSVCSQAVQSLTAPETRYLQSAQGQASEEDVAQRLGRPAAASTNQAGETVWVYQVREQEAGNRWTSTGLWCDEYVVTFDRQLRCTQLDPPIALSRGRADAVLLCAERLQGSHHGEG